MRNVIAFVAGTEDRADSARTSHGVRVGGLRIGRTELIVTGRVRGDRARRVALRSTRSGEQARALADSIQLAETTGIDTERIVLITWAVSGGLAGLAGIFYALPAGAVNPNLGFS